ncbi:MAG: hypothetical protein D8M60_22970 [Chloroflexi bacterium]|nr:hypothetical protein [Chloroflexota bacterium]
MNLNNRSTILSVALLFGFTLLLVWPLNIYNQWKENDTCLIVAHKISFPYKSEAEFDADAFQEDVVIPHEWKK